MEKQAGYIYYFFCAPEYIILYAIRLGSTKFERKILLQADPIERRTQNKTQPFNLSDKI